MQSIPLFRLQRSHAAHKPVDVMHDSSCSAQEGDRDVDVLFFGLMNPRRAALLAAVNASGLAVHVLTGETMTFGGALDGILARTKIVLNLHFYDGIMVRLHIRLHCPEAMLLA